MAQSPRKKNLKTTETYPVSNAYEPRAPIDSLDYTPSKERYFREHDNQKRAGTANELRPSLNALRDLSNPRNNPLKDAIRQKLSVRESTSVAGKDATTAQQDVNASKGMYLTDRQQILAQRAENKERRAKATAKLKGEALIPAIVGGADIGTEDLSDYFAGAGDSARLFPDDHESFIDDYLNPFVSLGDMASGLADVPKDIKDKNYLSAAINVAAPIVEAAGYVMGSGGASKVATKSAKEIAKKAAKVHANTQYVRAHLKHHGPKRAISVLKEEPWRLNPWSYEPPGENYMFRGIGPDAERDIYNSELVRTRNAMAENGNNIEPFPKYTNPEDPYSKVSGVSYPLSETKNLFASKYLDRAEEFGAQYGQARRVVEFPRDVSNRWRSKYGYNQTGDTKGYQQVDWSEYTPITENFQGIPAEKVRVLQPDKFKRYVETDQSKRMREQIKKRLDSQPTKPQQYMWRGLDYQGIKDAYKSGVLRAPRNSPFAGVKEADPRAYSEWAEHATPTQEVYYTPHWDYAERFGGMDRRNGEYSIFASVPKDAADFKVGVSWDGKRTRKQGEAPWAPEDGSDFSQWTDSSIPIEKAQFYKSKRTYKEGKGYEYDIQKIDPSEVYRWLDWQDTSQLWDQEAKKEALKKKNKSNMKKSIFNKLKSKIKSKISESNP